MQISLASHGPLAAWLALTVTASASAQATIRVPADQPTIQLAIAAAQVGDTVLVADGTYPEAIDLLGKAVEVRSENGAGATVIDGGGAPRYVVTCASGEGPGTVLSGFTITGGRGRTFFDPTPTGQGGGLRIHSASPTLRDLVIEANSGLEGGGVALRNGQPRFERVTFRANEGNNGGGMYAYNSRPTLIEVTFEGNRGLYGGGLHAAGQTLTIRGGRFIGNDARDFGAGLYTNHVQLDIDGLRCEDNGTVEALPHGAFILSVFGGGGLYATSCSGQLFNARFERNVANAGGGIYFAGGSTVVVANALIAQNLAGIGGGAVYYNGASTPLTNCTIVANSPSGIFTTFGSFPRLTNCVLSGNTGSHGAAADIQGNGVTGVERCVAADPLLFAVELGVGVEIVDPLLGADYAPLAGSRLIDAGDNSAVPAGLLTDLAGEIRFVDDPASPDRGMGSPPLVDIGAFEFQPALIQRSCTGKLTSEGRLPSVGWTGWPSVSGTFTVLLADALPNSPALLFYGAGPDLRPFQGGWLCAAPPLVRMPVTNTSASRTAEMTIPMHAGLVGATHYYQWWFRDVASQGGLGLSDALHVQFQH